MLMRTIEPAGAIHARPERMGSKKESVNSRGASWTEVYKSRLTLSGDPAVGRYAGTGWGIALRALSRSSAGGRAVTSPIDGAGLLSLSIKNEQIERNEDFSPVCCKLYFTYCTLMSWSCERRWALEGSKSKILYCNSEIAVPVRPSQAETLLAMIKSTATHDDEHTQRMRLIC